MDHLSMNPHLHITMEPPMMDGDTYSIYGAQGPYSNSIDDLSELVESQNIEGYQSICDDSNLSHWIIVQSTNTAVIAQGPFIFDRDHMVMNDDNWIIGITLGENKRFVEIKAPGQCCFDCFVANRFWVISMPFDTNGGQTLGAPTIPFGSNFVAIETNMDPTLNPPISEVEGLVSQALIGEHVDTMSHEIDTLCIGETNEKIVEPQLGHLVDFVGDGTNLGATRGNEGLSSSSVGPCLESGHGDQISELKQMGMYLCHEEAQTLGPVPNDSSTSQDDDVFAMFRDLESSQAFDCALQGQQMVDETFVSSSNLKHNNESARKRPWMDEETCSSLETCIGTVEATHILDPIFGDGPNGEAWAMSKRARMAYLPSPQFVLGSNALRGATNSNEVNSLKIIGTDSNGNENMAFSMLGGLMETQEGNAIHPLLGQGPSSSLESQSVNPLGNVEDISKDGEIQGLMGKGTIAIASTSFKGYKPSKKRPRQSRFKQHGVKRREGGRESFVAYFRPKDLPDSNKTFLTIGEFSDEVHAWYAFNLFAFVHEGQESCINMVDRDSIEEDAAIWGKRPRVDLVAQMRLEGRGYFKSNVLPSNSFIQRYRHIKFRKNAGGTDQGKIRWFCDIPLAKGVTDPNVDNGTKETSTYETAEAAAKEADRLSMLNEGVMAWTNYTILDYMTEEEKNQWDPMWIPLQDNPRKYLSTAKYKSFD